MTRVTAIQWMIAFVFFTLGGWCLLAPQQVLALSIKPEYQVDLPLVHVLMGCFGAQAVLSGLFAAFSRFTKTTFLAYGIAVLPFFVFNYWFYFVEPMFTKLMFLDAIGNVIFLVLCVYGYLIADTEAKRAETVD